MGDFTITVRDLKPDETVYVDGPFGYYDILDPAYKGMVLLAGGIGIAPAMSALRSMADSKDPRPVYLFYSNNHLDHLVFGEDLKKLETRLPKFKSFVILEEPPEDWEGYSGFITQDVLEQELPDDYANLAYFVCGPLPMMSAMRKVLGRLNVPAGKVHYEEFNMA